MPYNTGDILEGHDLASILMRQDFRPVNRAEYLQSGDFALGPISGGTVFVVLCVYPDTGLGKHKFAEMYGRGGHIPKTSRFVQWFRPKESST